MSRRAPIVLSSAAFVIAVLGATPLGQAAGERLTAVVPFAKNAGNAQRLNGHRSALSGAPGTIPVVGKNGRLPASLGAVGPQGRQGPQGERGPAGPAGPAGGSATGGATGASGPAGGALVGSFPNPQIAPNAVATNQVVDNSLTGADVDEATFAQVPAALLGGLGRTAPPAPSCDPESAAFVTCAALPLNLPARTRVLVIGRASAQAEIGADSGRGLCRLGTSVAGPVPDSAVTLVVIEGHNVRAMDSATLVAVTPPVGPGPVAFGIDCNQQAGGAVTFSNLSVTALAISPS